MTTNIDEAAEIIGRYVHPDFAEDAARDLAAEGHLAPAPQIIHTVAELEALDPDTVVLDRDVTEGIYPVSEYLNLEEWEREVYQRYLPAVVIRDGAQVRAADKALEEA